MAPHFSITGIPVDDASNIPQRREIVEWYNDAQGSNNPEAKLQLSLFIHGLSRLQDAPFFGPSGEPKDAQLSYYRVAGIHGAPLVDWDGTSPNGSYFCAHNKSTFPTWHRPYIILYEQLIYNNMLAFLNDPKTKFAGKYTKDDWLAAAKKWRLPYWNYAVRPTMPDIATQPSITVFSTEGKNEPIPHNPVYSFRPKDGNGNNIAFGHVPRPLTLPVNGNLTETVRGSLQDINDALKQDMPHSQSSGPGKAQGVISENVARLMTENYFRNYTAFASTRYTEALKASEWLSLENLHNYIHGDVGGFMGGQNVSAFDPIFWHHHCFIDMIFDSWQTATNHSSWFDPSFITNTLKRQPAESDAANFELKPFFNGDTKKLYNSEDTKWVTKLGYKYDRTLPSTKADVAKAVGTSLRRMVNTKLSMTRSETAEFLPADRKTDNDLIINVRYNRFGINNGEPYWIHLFVGDVGEPAGYMSNPDRVGSIYNFTSPVEQTGCESCKKEISEGGLATGQIPITGAILKDWKNDHIPELPSSGPFNEHTVEQYLAEKLSWKVITANGQPISTESLPDLKVFVLLGDADHSTDELVETRFTNYEYLWEATAGKAGGGVPTDL